MNSPRHPMPALFLCALLLLVLNAPAQAAGIVRQWNCNAVGQYGIEVPVGGEGRSYVREHKTPVQITVRDTGARNAYTVEMRFGGEKFMSVFGHAFVGDMDSTVAYTSQVLRAVSTSSSAGTKALVVEQENQSWRFVTSTPSLMTTQRAGQLSLRCGGKVKLRAEASTSLFTGECALAIINAEGETRPARSVSTAPVPKAYAMADPDNDSENTTADPPALPPSPSMKTGTIRPPLPQSRTRNVATGTPMKLPSAP